MSALRDSADVVLSELGSVLRSVDDQQFATVAGELARAHRVFVIGVGREGLAARGFAMRLAHLGLESHWGWDDTTPGVTPGDVVVMVNGSGSIGHLDYVFARVRDAGATTIVVTGVADAETPRAADVTLVVPAAVYRGTGALVASIQPMGTLFEQSVSVVFDLLVLELVERRGTTFDALAARHRNFE